MFITVSDSQLHAKLLEMETIAEERLKAIADLETQKFDLVQGINNFLFKFLPTGNIFVYDKSYC